MVYTMFDGNWTNSILMQMLIKYVTSIENTKLAEILDSSNDLASLFLGMEFKGIPHNPSFPLPPLISLPSLPCPSPPYFTPLSGTS